MLAEYLYRTWEPGRPWLDGLWMWVPLQLTIGYCVFRMVTVPGATILDAVIWFTAATALMRVLVTVFVLEQTVTVPTWIGFGLVVLANLIKPLWGKVFVT